MVEKARGAGSKKAPKAPAETHRFTVCLSRPTKHKNTTISYKELFRKHTGALSGDEEDGLEDNEERKQMKAIVARLNDQYKDEKTRKRPKVNADDLMDLGMGYDQEDPFIDDTEAYDELVPSGLDTEKGGFYVNNKRLAFQPIFEDGNSSSSSAESRPSSRNKNKKLITKRDKDKVSKTISEEEKAKKDKEIVKTPKRRMIVSSEDEDNLPLASSCKETQSSSARGSRSASQESDGIPHSVSVAIDCVIKKAREGTLESPKPAKKRAGILPPVKSLKVQPSTKSPSLHAAKKIKKRSLQLPENLPRKRVKVPSRPNSALAGVVKQKKSSLKASNQQSDDLMQSIMNVVDRASTSILDTDSLVNFVLDDNQKDVDAILNKQVIDLASSSDEDRNNLANVSTSSTEVETVRMTGRPPTGSTKKTNVTVLTNLPINLSEQMQNSVEQFKQFVGRGNYGAKKMKDGGDIFLNKIVSLCEKDSLNQRQRSEIMKHISTYVQCGPTTLSDRIKRGTTLIYDASAVKPGSKPVPEKSKSQPIPEIISLAKAITPKACSSNEKPGSNVTASKPTHLNTSPKASTSKQTSSMPATPGVGIPKSTNDVLDDMMKLMQQSQSVGLEEIVNKQHNDEQINRAMIQQRLLQVIANDKTPAHKSDQASKSSHNSGHQSMKVTSMTPHKSNTNSGATAKSHGSQPNEQNILDVITNQAMQLVNQPSSSQQSHLDEIEIQQQMQLALKMAQARASPQIQNKKCHVNRQPQATLQMSHEEMRIEAEITRKLKAAKQMQETQKVEAKRHAQTGAPMQIQKHQVHTQRTVPKPLHEHTAMTLETHGQTGNLAHAQLAALQIQAQQAAAEKVQAQETVKKIKAQQAANLAHAQKIAAKQALAQEIAAKQTKAQQTARRAQAQAAQLESGGKKANCHQNMGPMQRELPAQIQQQSNEKVKDRLCQAQELAKLKQDLIALQAQKSAPHTSLNSPQNQREHVRQSTNCNNMDILQQNQYSNATSVRQHPLSTDLARHSENVRHARQTVVQNAIPQVGARNTSSSDEIEILPSTPNARNPSSNFFQNSSVIMTSPNQRSTQETDRNRAPVSMPRESALERDIASKSNIVSTQQGLYQPWTQDHPSTSKPNASASLITSPQRRPNASAFVSSPSFSPTIFRMQSPTRQSPPFPYNQHNQNIGIQGIDATFLNDLLNSPPHVRQFMGNNQGPDNIHLTPNSQNNDTTTTRPNLSHTVRYKQ